VKTASATKMVATQFYDFLEASREQPVLITRNGKPVAVLLAVQNKAEAEQIAAGRSRSLRSVFAEAHEQIQEGGGILCRQFWREVEQSRRGKKPGPASTPVPHRMVEGYWAVSTCFQKGFSHGPVR
jgi:prevent-host-death family protein